MIQVKMTPEQFAAKADELLAKQGVALTGNYGTIEKHGVRAEYNYADGTLTVSIKSKPFLVTTKYCEDQLLSWLAGS